MTRIPKDAAPDSTLSFLADPYRFIGARARELDSDVFETRLLGQRTVCLVGRDAGALFYDTSKMQRAGAMPGRILKTLLGEGGVQSLDGEMHRVRKALFLSLATGDGLERVVQLADAQWSAHARRWQTAGKVTLYDGAVSVLAYAAFEWVGLPLQAEAADTHIADVMHLFDGAGAVGPRHWKARLARKRLEGWLSDVIEQVRDGRTRVDPDAPLAQLARHRDADGALLPPRVAAVELLNLIRPVVAVSVFVTFVAHALHRHPAAREHIAAGDVEAQTRFVQEVRRFYPFFPAVAARTRTAFSWNGFEFPEDVRVMFDLYGTSHDPRIWHQPDRFDPDRFKAPFDATFGLVPQGGGHHASGHRCPGEWITIALMRQAAGCLTDRLDYTVAGDPQIDFARVPALPDGGMVLENVRLR